jgi:hypothetical protein
MANFENIKNVLEGTVNSQINATRQTAGVWEWFNALYRIMSANRFAGTPKVYGVAATAAAAAPSVLETVAAKVFGLLVDNPMAAEDAYIALSNVASTAGTTDTKGYFFAPRAAVTEYVFPEPLVFTSRLELFAVLGTEAGLEAGTASTTPSNVVVVYTIGG